MQYEIKNRDDSGLQNKRAKLQTSLSGENAIWKLVGKTTNGTIMKVTDLSPSYTGRIIFNAKGKPWNYEKK
jgi:hypothetical protein